MKVVLPVLFLALFVVDANAARSRPAMISSKVMASPRYTASVNQLNTMSAGAAPVQQVQAEKTEEEKAIDRREAERNACINNNIGIGNTFVWASKYSNTLSYANMIEDVEHPENNVCFVRVELSSDNESRVKVADIEPKYFMWGENIDCGSWVNEKDMEQRILDARKGARIGGIVASTVGGAGLGVGAMELFGNLAIDKMAGGNTGLRGQKGLEDDDLIRSKLLVMEKEPNSPFRDYVEAMKIIKQNSSTDSAAGSFYNNHKALIDEFANK